METVGGKAVNNFKAFQESRTINEMLHDDSASSHRNRLNISVEWRVVDG
jgi:hypothetical protein